MKALLLLFLLLAAPLLTMGQKFNYGVSLGLNSSNINENYFGTMRKMGIHAGLKIEYAYAKNLYFHSLLAFSQKGAIAKIQLIDADGNLLQGEVDDKLTLSYIDFPLLVSPVFYYSGIRMYPIVGIDQGYLIGAVNELPELLDTYEVRINKYNLLMMKTPKYVNTPVTVHRYNMGLTAGFGSQFYLSPKLALFIDARFSYFLTPVIDAYGISKFRSNTVAFNTGMLF